jgi:uncharacterized protein DUF3850
MIHELKADPVMFERLVWGSKTFELRRDDRGYQTGDTLVIRSFDPAKDDDCGDPGCFRNYRAPGRVALRYTIGFVAKGNFYGLSLGDFAILSLMPWVPREPDWDEGMHVAMDNTLAPDISTFHPRLLSPDRPEVRVRLGFEP